LGASSVHLIDLYSLEDKMLISKTKMETFEWTISKNSLKARGLHPMGAPLVHPTTEQKSGYITNP
jgi:hypothetical protein